MRNLLFPLVIFLFVGGYWFYVQSKSKQAMAALGPAMHAYFLKSGFRYPDLPPEPVEAHVHKAMTEANAPPPADGNRVIQYVRNFHGMPILFEQAYLRTETGNSISASWSTALRAPPRIPFHIADRSLSSMGKAVREAFSNMTRTWEPRFPQPVQTGIPQIDARFVVFGFDPNAVRALFSQNPALCQLLLQCVEVDLWIDASSCRFADPLQKNMNAAMGGMVGSMALGFDYGKRMEMSIPVHERMSELLALAVRASA
jgi:hypothetical protein